MPDFAIMTPCSHEYQAWQMPWFLQLLVGENRVQVDILALEQKTLHTCVRLSTHTLLQACRTSWQASMADGKLIT